MIPTIDIAAAEHRRGQLSNGHRAEAWESLQDHGVVVLQDALPNPLVERLGRAYFGRYGGASEEELDGLGTRVGHERWMVSVPFEDPFDDPGVYAPPMIQPVLADALGEGYLLSSYCAVTSYPGAARQHVHRDHELLFPEDEALSFSVPPYALTVVVPLVDLDVSTGGTQVWADSHRGTPSLWSRMTGGERLRLPKGSAFIMDYRLLHGGEPNQGQVARPVLYLAYARPWFQDACNFGKHPPVRIEEADKARVPEDLRGLFGGVPYAARFSDLAGYTGD